jgi:Tfp pilus assembly protein PilX
MGMTRQPLRRQRGATLIVGLIMLIVITLLVVGSFTLGRNNLEIVGNMQHRNETTASAQRAIEEAISSPLLTTTPGNIFQPPCSAQNTKCYNVTKDSTNTTADQIAVTLTPTPTCVKAEVVKTANLNLSLLSDQRCVVQQNQDLGIENVDIGDSLCADSTWEVRAVAADAATKAQSVITQGVATRVRAVDIAASCP